MPKKKPNRAPPRRVRSRSGVPRRSRELYFLLAEGREQERKRIAEELHDGVLQSLVRVKIDLEKLVSLAESQPPRTVAQELSGLAGQVRDCIKEIRAILSDLLPPHLEHIDVVDALHRCIDAFRDRCPAQVRRRLAPIRAELSPEQKLGVFRILQEALSNVHKHANASRVEVELSTTERGLRLRIHDNGRGFEERKPKPGHSGLRNMRSRAEALGGSTVIQSSIGGGTSILTEIPFLEHGAGGDAGAHKAD